MKKAAIFAHTYDKIIDVTFAKKKETTASGDGILIYTNDDFGGIPADEEKKKAFMSSSDEEKKAAIRDYVKKKCDEEKDVILVAIEVNLFSPSSKIFPWTKDFFSEIPDVKFYVFCSSKEANADFLEEVQAENLEKEGVQGKGIDIYKKTKEKIDFINNKS